MFLFFLLGGLLTLPACQSQQRRSPLDAPAARRTLAATHTPTRAEVAAVRIYDENEKPDAHSTELGQVTAAANARYASGIEAAERRARRKLQRAAAELGADTVMITDRRVIELDHDPIVGDHLTPSFEGDTRDRLRPGDSDAMTGRTVWRVRLVGVGVKTGE